MKRDLAMNRIVGQCFKMLRENHDLKQSDLASRMDVSRTTITNIEQGTQSVTIANLAAFAVALKLSSEQIGQLVLDAAANLRAARIVQLERELELLREQEPQKLWRAE